MAVNRNAEYPNVLLGEYTESGYCHNIAVYGYDAEKGWSATNSITDYSYNAQLTYYQGFPYVLYTDTSNKFKLVRYVNDQWETVKSDSISNINYSEMIATSTGLYYAYYDEDTGSGTLQVKEYDGQTFSDAYTSGNGSFAQMYMCKSNDTVYFSCRNAAANDAPIVLSIKGETATVLPVPSTGGSNCAVYTDGSTLFLLCANGGTSKEAVVYQYNDAQTAFTKVDNSISIKDTTNAAIVSYQGMPITLLTNSSGYTTVWRNDSDVWTQEGTSLLSSEMNMSSMAMIGSECYVAGISNNIPYIKHKTIQLKETRPSSTAEVTDISVQVNKSEYKTGDVFSASDITVNAVLSNNDKKVLNTSEYALSSFDTSTAGQKTVTVTYGSTSIQTTYQINVTQNSTVVNVTGVTLSPTSLSLNTGNTAKLSASISPNNATNKNVTWSSSSSAVSVDGSGNIQANRSGNAVITVKTADGGYTASCSVAVSDPAVAVTGIGISSTSLSLNTGNTTHLYATVYPTNATNKAVTWNSSDTSVASVDGSGNIQANRAGNVIITVRTADGGYTASCSVSVVDPTIAVTGIGISSTSLSLKAGKKTSLAASVYPANATNKTVTWSSSKSNVASVDGSGNVVAVNGRTATISVTTVDGNRTASCIVTVIPLKTGVTVYNGIDYSLIYDFNYYIQKNPDVRACFGSDDDIAVLWHFVNFGMSEGRESKETFDVRSYRNAYQDLREAYGKSWKSYCMHYLNFGRYEGRNQLTGITSIINPVTIYQGRDYSSVYDFNYYIQKNADVKACFGSNDDTAVLWHFVNYGMSEGRESKETFDVRSYRNAYQDLREAYGMNWKSYYMHYLNFGRYEARICY